MHKLLYFLLCALSLLLVACAKEGLKKEDLIGNWALVHGTLNGQTAAQFEGFTMNFTADSLYSIMISEMSNGQSAVPYNIAPENKIEMRGVPIPFYIERLDKDTLTLSFDLQRDGEMYNMQMTFKKG